MKFAVLFLAPAVALASAGPPPRAESSSHPAVTAESIVRVNSTNQSYDFFRPWMKKPPYPRRGLGVVVAGGDILVTAELVANHTYVELEKSTSAEKSPAEVVAIDHDANLALLRPTNPGFLAGAAPVALDEGARVGDQASILQLEANGVLARTPATLTTIALSNYPMDQLPLLVFRLSAPLQNRDGSFTIPAVRDGRLLGLLMRYDSRSQSAEVIPSPVIAHFLEDAAKAPYTGFPRVGVGFASTRDPQLRRYVGLTENGGVYVTSVKPGSPAEADGLRKGDVILAVGGHSIDQDGNYEHPEFGKLPFGLLTTTLARAGDVVEFSILRDGKTLTVPVTLTVPSQDDAVSSRYLFGRAPRYFILGGLVFQELTRPYLQEWGGGWMKEAPQRLVYLDAYQDEHADRRRIVFLSQVLPTPDTLGYENLDHVVVTRVNGREIKNLDDLAEAVTHPINGFHRIEFEEDPGFIVLDATSVEHNQPQLMEDYGLPAMHNVQPVPTP